MPEDSINITNRAQERRNSKERRKGVETERTMLNVLDSNVFMLNGPTAIFQYGKNNVYITGTVREELNHNKKEKRRIGEHVRQTNAFITAALRGKTLRNIREGIPITSLAHLVFESSMRVNATGLLFIETEECENDPIFFSEEFKDGKIVSVTLKLSDDKEMVVQVSEDVGRCLKKAFKNMNDRSILASIKELKKNGEPVILITNDIKLTADAIVQGIQAESYQETMQVTQKNAKKRHPGRITSQRNYECS
ncbi:MAG: PIN domain-containing protein [Candidatus Paceibacterota bacterium]|jgi:predicted ribonuclease YlaK|nr:PIN domain-containing protein [Candidatus Paceibacterota bacterium]